LAKARRTAGDARHVLLGFLSIGVIAAQTWWRVPLEQKASPEDILGLMLGLILALSAAVTSRILVSGSPARRLVTVFAGLFGGYSIGEYILDAGVIDISHCVGMDGPWICPCAFVLAHERLCSALFFRGPWCRNARARSQHTERCVASPPVFLWIESESDFLVRAFYLLGFLEMLIHVGLFTRPGRLGSAFEKFSSSRHPDLRASGSSTLVSGAPHLSTFNPRTRIGFEQARLQNGRVQDPGSPAFCSGKVPIANSISPISTGQPSARLISCGPCDRISSEGEDSGFSFCRASKICRSISYRRVWEADRLTE